MDAFSLALIRPKIRLLWRIVAHGMEKRRGLFVTPCTTLSIPNAHHASSTINSVQKHR
jgi:hypothetical protein